MKAITMEDVARKAKVSKSTVSQYINNRYEYMSEETRKRIQTAIETLGYQPNYVAKSLKQKKTSTIGVIVSNILHYFSTQVIHSVEDVCNSSNFSVIVCNADNDPLKERKYIEMMRAKQIDGLIIAPTQSNYELYRQMMKEKYPFVFVDRLVEGIDVPSILMDNESASDIAVNHLYEKGYTKIGMLVNSLADNVTPRIERLVGYKKALAQRGLPVLSDYYAGVPVKEMQAELNRMFSLPDPPHAFVAGNDVVLLEVLRFVKNKGFRIPEDVALVSIDEVSFSEIYHPRLTTISQPAIHMGKRAAEILLKQIETGGAGDPEEIRYSVNLIERDST